MSTAVRAVPVGHMQRPPRLPALSAAMLTELDAVLKGEFFRQAADLSALLRYLVGCTLDGEDDRLTAYAITVEGFGGVNAFETEHSGAPQRHIDRLRATLEAHYAENDPADGLCLTLIAGAYRVWVVRPEVAYPLIFCRPKMVEWPLVPKARRILAEPVGV
jgi:hypothetical protein